MFIPPDIVDTLKKLDCEDVAMKLGIKVARHKARCFMHEDKVPSLSFYGPDRSKWHCFSCSKGGNAISLVMEVASLDFADACRWLCSVYAIHLLDVNQKFLKKRIKIRKIEPVSGVESKSDIDAELALWAIDNLELSPEARQFLFGQRLLDEDVVKDLRIVSVASPAVFSKLIIERFGEERCKKSGLLNDRLNPCFWTPCIIFPFFDVDHRLIGLQTRYIGNNKKAPRFQFLSGRKSHIFNLPILKGISPGSLIYITEGVTDCLAMLSDHINAVAIPSATIIPQHDLWLLRDFRLCMSPDADEAGKSGFIKLRETLLEDGQMIYLEPLPDGFKDYAEYHVYKTRTQADS